MSGVSSFTIELERSNGIYYGGEVVRGKVKLVTTKDIKTRGVRIRFQGVGHMHFHTGSGDNRHDYYGTKIFEEHRYTMFGNYYNTTILDEAGADAIFGAASGDGIMYIPCNEDEKLNLIVRVMDYDFGKKDDLLGEIVLDANRLVVRGEPSSFGLTRHGKPEKGEVTLSAKIVPMNALFPASHKSTSAEPFAGFGRAQGRSYNAICQLRTHQATGLRKADFLGRNDVYVQAYRAPEGTHAGTASGRALQEPDVTAVLPAGTLEFPFAFTVRTDAPGSAELPVGDAAHIRYSLYANVDIAWWRDPSVRRVITVLSARPLPSPALLRGVEYQCAVPMPLASCCCLPCLTGIGNITLDAKLLRQAFAPGEALEFSLRLWNNTSAVLVVECVLLCTVLLQVTGRLGGHATFEVPYVLHSDTVDSQDTYALSYGDTSITSSHADSHLHTTNPTANTSNPSNAYSAVRSHSITNTSTTTTTGRLIIPHVFPSFNGASGLATARKEPVTHAYSVVFKATTPGCCGTSKYVTLPVVICGAPPTTTALNTSRLSTSRCVVQPVPHCDPFGLSYSREYVPAVEADREPLPEAHVVPVGGSVVTFLREEDSAAVATALPYQPYALCYTSSGASIVNKGIDSYEGSKECVPSAPMAGAITTTSTTNTDTTAITVAAGNTTSTNTATTDLAALIRALSLSTDLRATVRAHLHPHNTITPHDIQAILQSVSFSMDQVTVAHEIAQCVVITCAHVVSACGVCTFFKTEVVCGMVPFVRDVQHKESVLVLLPVYERSRAEALFPQV